MKIYKNRTFDRWARKYGLNNLSLCNAVNEMAAGLYDADLGGGLFKKRIAKPGKGKSGGFRTLIVTNPVMSNWEKPIPESLSELNFSAFG
ncbi:type II toxin-antitoxin system RelE/ParE family toxin [Nostoc sp. UHCC 0302]